jgi:hypothetical protein
MVFRSRLLTFLLGGALLGLGIVLLRSVEPWEAATLQRWENTEPPVGMLAMSGVLIVVGLCLVVAVLIGMLGHTAFRETTLEPPEGGALLGGNARVLVRLVPRGSVQVSSAELRLITEERANYVADFPELASDSDDSQKGYLSSVMEVHRWSSRLELPAELREPWEQSVPVPIPLELPPSFRWARHAVATRLELEVVLVGRMDLELVRELIILPREA